MNRWQAFRSAAQIPLNERGSALIMVAVALAAILAIAAISIDAAVMVTTRTQLQNAADAAALAGASAMIDTPGDQNEAVARAMSFAALNTAQRDGARSAVVITPADVTFPSPDVIRVTTHRTASTGDALRVFFRKVVDPASNNQADVTAVAAAQAYDVCGSVCMKPWAIPDRWSDDNANSQYDGGELYDPQLTGYQAPGDIGLTVTLKVGNPQQTMTPGMFYPVNYPPLDQSTAPLTGASWYRQWISECEPYIVGIGDRLQIEPGNMVGPTDHGMDELIALDPNATWDSVSNTVINSAYGNSPRIALVPLFDPTQAPNSGRNWVTVTQVAAFFIEQNGPGGQVTGRFLDYTAPGVPCGTGLGSGLVKGLSLVE